MVINIFPHVNITCIHARVDLFTTLDFGFGLICGLTSQSTAMVISRRSINLTKHFFPGQAKTKLLTWPQAYKTFFMLNSTEHKISTANIN